MLEEIHNKLKKKWKLEKEEGNWSCDISKHVWGLGVESGKEGNIWGQAMFYMQDPEEDSPGERNFKIFYFK